MKKTKTFTFSTGVTVHLRQVSAFMLTRLVVDKRDKYPIPEKVERYGTRQTEKLVPDYNNAFYKELVEEQRAKDQGDTLANISVLAVQEDVPTSEYDFYLQMAIATIGEDKVTEHFIKSLWILDQIQSQEELAEFQEAILGMEGITEKGIEISEEKFQDDN